MPKVSVVIPCYNLGEFIEETIASVFAQTYKDIEVVVVNDGSTDSTTLDALDRISANGIKVFTTENQGLASARNYGIQKSAGEYILPLDADDLIEKQYIETAATVLDGDSGIGIVYGKAKFFGARKGLWRLPSFSLDRMAVQNCIYCSALFRKNDWEAVSGYNRNMQHGWEDWDFWLSILELGKHVYYIPSVVFFYRIRHGSMVQLLTDSKKADLHYQLFKNHPQFFESHMRDVFFAFYSCNHSLSEKIFSRLPMRFFSGAKK